jgi:ribosome-associated protein
VEDPVDVEQNGRHVRRVYSRHPLREPARPESRVEAVLDVEASSALTDRQKRRVVSRSGPVLRAVAQDERSQWRNRELAVERLVETLRRALAVERPRRPTAPTAASRERRLEQKRRRSQTKRLRRPPT